MKKRVVFLVLSALLVLGMAAVTFGGENAIVPDMNFVGEAKNLSLEEAVKIMQTEGSRAETARLNKVSDEAIAKGHKESAQSMRDFFRQMQEMNQMIPGGTPISISYEAEQIGMTDSNEKITKIRRDFANEQLENNYQAELNEIEAMTIQVYYGILLAEENLNVAKDNLVNQQAIYDNTMKKFKLGAVAKVDTIMAETQVLNAKDQVALAETSIINAKMNFNLLLGYDLMQEIKLTDQLKMVAGPEGNLTGFVQSALKNRNEIKGVALGVEIQQILLDSLNYRYPKNSATYLKQEVATLQAKKLLEDIPSQIEMDIRARYLDIADKKRGIEVAEANLKTAKEGYRIATVSFNAGVNTFTDVQEAQLNSYRAAMGVTAAINAYDLAVYEFNHAIGSGTMRLSL